MTRAVVGIDPGNDSAGISWWYEGRCVHHATVKVWSTDLDETFHIPWMPDAETVIMYVEVPPQTNALGTPKSRAGVNFAAGMMVQLVRECFPVRRGAVHKIVPREWRMGVLGRNPKAAVAKEIARSMATEYAPMPIVSDDEAEAVLIGLYGWRKEYWREPER